MQNDREMLKAAYMIAFELSDDPDTKNGAVVVSADGVIIGRGANRFPRSVQKRPDRLKRPNKYNYMIHAEQDAISNAARQGHATLGATLYCPWAACTSCAQLLIQAGIVRVVVHKQMHDRTPPRWQSLIAHAVEMFEEAGVIYEQFDGEIGGVTNLFDSEKWTP